MFLAVRNWKDLIEVVMRKASEKEKLLKDDSYTAVIEVPENFTYRNLSIHVSQWRGTALNSFSIKMKGLRLGTSVVRSILEQLQKQLTLSTYLGQQGIQYQEIQQSVAAAITDEIKTINQKEPVSTKSYYTIGMAVMNVFFIASAISSIAYTEKKIHVFDRIIIRKCFKMGLFLRCFPFR